MRLDAGRRPPELHLGAGSSACSFSHMACWSPSNSAGGWRRCPEARHGFLPARAVGHSQQRGLRQYQTAGATTSPRSLGSRSPAQSSCGRHTGRVPSGPLGIGEQYSGMRLPIGLQHTPTGPPGAVQRRVLESPHPVPTQTKLTSIAISADCRSLH